MDLATASGSKTLGASSFCRASSGVATVAGEAWLTFFGVIGDAWRRRRSDRMDQRLLGAALAYAMMTETREVVGGGFSEEQGKTER